ncbi:MAG: hypothetical protein J6X61_02145 [Clostridia bacterium]|nr:hypothetical protein [Clostridia bacterium]
MTEKGVRAVRRDLFRRGLILAAVGLLIAGLTVYSFGWFVNSVRVTGEGLSVKVATDDYNLAVSGDQELRFPDNHPIVNYLKQSAVGGYQKLASTNAANPALLCRMANERPHVVGSEEIAPGAFGTVSFDIVVPENSQYTAFTINLSYLPVASTSAGLASVNAADENELRALLSGHILLFKTRSDLQGGGRYYSDPIDGSITFTLAEHTPTQEEDGLHYTVTFYWIWPSTFGQMVFADGDERVHSHAVFSSSAERAAMISRMVSEPNDFFHNLDSNTVDLTADGFEDYYYVELSEAYNAADQFLGDRIRYLAVIATVVDAEE